MPPGQVHPLGRYTPPQAGTPPGSYTPWAGTLPRAGTPPRAGTHPWEGTPPWAGTCPRAGTPPGKVHPPQEQYMLRDTGKKRTVRILLECILVRLCLQMIHHWLIWRCGCITVPSVNPNSKIFMDFFRKYRQKVAPFAFQEIHSCSPFKFMPCLLYHQTSFWWMSKLHIIYVTGANNEA